MTTSDGDIAGSLCNKDAGFNDDDAPVGTALAALSGLATIGSFGCEELASTVLRIRKQRPTFQTGTDGASQFADWNSCGSGGCETHSWPSSR